jgi:DNA-binding transcriptional LysR family regulator
MHNTGSDRRKRFRLISLVYILSLSISGCSSWTEPAQNFIIVDATPATFPYAMRLVQTFRQRFPSQPTILINPTSLEQGWDAIKDESAEGFILLDPPTDQYHTSSLGWASLVIVAPAASPLPDTLTRDQVRSIFLRGNLPDAGSLAGNEPGLARLYVYDPGTDIQRLFNTLVLEGLQPASTATSIPEPTALGRALGADSQAIGFTTCAEVPKFSKVFRINGVLPPRSAKLPSPDYPFQAPLLITSKTEWPTVLKDFIGWAQTGEGQNVLAQMCDMGGDQ